MSIKVTPETVTIGQIADAIDILVAASDAAGPNKIARVVIGNSNHNNENYLNFLVIAGEAARQRLETITNQ